MYVAFAADCRGIAEARGDVFDRGAEIALRLGGASKLLSSLTPSRPARCPPMSGIFRGDVRPVICLSIVDVGRGDVLRLSFFVHVLDEFLAGKVLTRLDDLCNPSIVHTERPLLAAFASKSEPNLVSIDSDMPVFQCRQTKAVVLPCIVVIADPDERALEKVNDGGEDFLPRESGQGHVLANLLSDGRKRLGERDDISYLVLSRTSRNRPW